VPARAVRRLYFKVIAAVCIILGVSVSAAGGVQKSLMNHVSPLRMDCQALITVLISALIILSVLKRFRINASCVYAVLGALEAWMITSGNDTDYGLPVSFIVAPVVAFALSALMRLVFRLTLDRTRIHLITLSYYMRYAVIAGLILLAFASGLNWGGFLAAGASLIAGSQSALWVTVTVLLLSVISLSPFMRDESDATAGKYSDFSIYAVLSVGYGVALTLLFFSFGGSAGLLGLKPVPLSVGSLVIASVAGVEVVKKSHLIERDEYAKEGLALLLAPLGAMTVAYLIFRITGNGDEQMQDFTVISAAILTLLALVFYGYVVRNRRQREATERLVYIQQQQIYENSRALNDMELKVVLSENQALHNSVEVKQQEVMNVALSIVEQKEYLQSLNEIVKKLSKAKDETEKDGLIAELGSSLRQRLSYDRDVDSQYFYAQAESLHEDFNAKLTENFPDLTQQERRLATLLRLGFSSKYIATLMNITPKSVEIGRYRLRQKLGLSKGDNLVNFIKSI
jgi:DNA-binding NarL/FixJ family response regulator